MAHSEANSMMEITYYIFIFILFVGCSSTRLLEANLEIPNKMEPSKCHYAIRIQDDENYADQNPFILKIENPKYRQQKIKYTEDEIQQFKIGEDIFSIPIRPHHFKFIFSDKVLLDFTYRKYIEKYVYCLVEVPIVFKTISTEELIEINWELTTTVVVKHSKLIRKNVKRKPKKLNKNELYFNKGDWTEERVASYSAW